MSLDELQKEINNLLYLYFNGIGVLQRDFSDINIDNTIDLLIQDLKICKSKIDSYLKDTPKEEIIMEKRDEIIRDGEVFVSEGLFLINRIANLK